MYGYIFFDLDGTLTDPGEGITNSVAHALTRFGIDVPERAELYKFIGPPLKDSFAKYYGMSPEESTTALKYYREYYADKGIFENAVYDGVETMLSDIKKSGRKIIMATSKPDVYAEKILEHFGLMKYFDFVAGADMAETRVAKADVIAHALDSCGLRGKTGEILMVGDREHDVLGAAAHGIDALGVTFGYGSADELMSAGAKYLANTPLEILNFI
jgi:phosphoglycolate phosphatase